MEKVRAIYLHWPEADLVWRDILFETIGEKHVLTEYDPQESLEPQFADVDALLDHGGRIATPEIIDASPNLKLWQMITVGYDIVDLGIADGRDIAVCHCPGTTTSPGLAESAIMFMLMLVKRYRYAQAYVAEGRVSRMLTEELEGRILAIIGFGASGRRLAIIARAFGMRLIIIEPRSIEQAVLDELRPEFVGTPDDLDRAVAEADFVSLHLPLLPDTRGLIDARRIKLMKPTACLINVARAGLVDEDALNAALLEGRIAGVGSDVFADNRPGKEIPAFGHEGLMALPHVAGTSFGTVHRRSAVCLENLNRIAQGLEPQYRVR